MLWCNVFLNQLARTFDIVVFAKVLLKFDIHKLCNRVASIKSAAFIVCLGTYADRWTWFWNIGASIFFWHDLIQMVRNCSVRFLERLNISISQIFQSECFWFKFVGEMIEFRTDKTCNYCCMAMHTLKEANHIWSISLVDLTRNNSLQYRLKPITTFPSSFHWSNNSSHCF